MPDVHSVHQFLFGHCIYLLSSLSSYDFSRAQSFVFLHFSLPWVGIATVSKLASTLLSSHSSSHTWICTFSCRAPGRVEARGPLGFSHWSVGDTSKVNWESHTIEHTWNKRCQTGSQYTQMTSQSLRSFPKKKKKRKEKKHQKCCYDVTCLHDLSSFKTALSS